MADSRQRIIVQLKKSGEASVSDLSRALGLTSVTGRHHLQELRRDGVVDEPRARRRKGPGRPEMAYHLTHDAGLDLPRNYKELCVSLVDQLSGEMSTIVLEDVLVRAAENLSRASLTWRDTGRSRAECTQAFLEERGYFPRLRQVGEEWKLHLANCPYQEIARHVPEMCCFDRALVAGLMGTNVRMEASIAGGAAACSFALAGEPSV